MKVDDVFDCFYFHFDLILFTPWHVNILTVKRQTEASENQTPHYNVSWVGCANVENSVPPVDINSKSKVVL